MSGKCDKLIDEIMPSIEDVLDHTPAGDFFMDCMDIDEEYERLCRAEGIDPRTDNEEMRKLAEEKAMDRARSAYEEAVYEIKGLFYLKDRIDAYREIYVNDAKEFIESLSKHEKTLYRGEMIGVGTYWAWDSEHAFAYGHSATGGIPLTLVTTVGCEDIDLEFMIGDYMQYSSKESGNWERENEVNLLKDRKIVISKILTRKGENLIEGRTIKAWT